MNPPALDIAKYLSENSAAGVLHGASDWAVHVASEPETPESVVTIYDTAGLGPDTDELDEFQPSFQIRVRSANYEEAYQRHELIREALIHENVVCETSQFPLIVLTSGIVSIGMDENNRHILTATYSSRRTQKET